MTAMKRGPVSMNSIIFRPTKSERKNGMLCKRACQCTLCGSPADRYHWGFQCQKHQGHMADGFVGIFSDLTHPRQDEVVDHMKERRRQWRLADKGIVEI